MRALVAGSDADGLGDALAAAGVEVTRVDGIATRPAMEEAGLLEADLFVLTDVAEATAIPIARDLTDGLRVVVYTEDSLPEFVAGMEVVRMDPRLLGPEAVAEELLDGS